MSDDEGLGQIDAFEKRLKQQRGMVLEESESSEESIDEVPASGLSNQNVRLQAKVQILIQQLIDKDKEIESLNQALSYTQIDEADEGDFRDKKLIDLAKKTRSMQVALESEKNRAARAMEEVNRLREQLADLQVEKTAPRKAQQPSKLKSMESQLQQIRLKYHQAKTDLSKANRILQREVGDFESLDKVLANENWRGRQQQIEALKSRVSDLNRQLQQIQKAGNIPQPQLAQSTVIRDASAEERRKEITALRQQLDEKDAEVEEWKKRAKGAAARKANVEKELKETKEKQKGQVRLLLDKADNDDRLIAALKDEVERVRRSKGLPASDPTRNEVNSVKIQLIEARKHIAAIQQELKEKEEIIELFKINNLDDEEVAEDDMILRRRIQELEKQVESLQRENAQTSRQSKRGSSEDTKLIKELSSQNARLRSKINDLTEELNKYRGT